MPNEVLEITQEERLVGMCVMSILIVIAQNLMLEEGSEQTGGSGTFLIIVTLGFVVFFAVGPGSIPWMIAGEMFTQGPRPAASAVVVFVNWAANLTVSPSFIYRLTLSLIIVRLD